MNINKINLKYCYIIIIMYYKIVTIYNIIIKLIEAWACSESLPTSVWEQGLSLSSSAVNNVHRPKVNTTFLLTWVPIPEREQPEG